MPFLANSRYLWRVWRANARASFIREMEFRANFFLGILRQGLWLAAFIFLLEIIFSHTESIAGWQKPEALIILALSRIVEGIMDTFFTRNIADLPTIVQKGSFDFYLTKPSPVLFYTSFKQFYLHSTIGHISGGLAVFLYALSQLDHQPNLSAWLIMILLVMTGLIIFYSLLILLASLVFYIERLEALWSFLQLMTEPLTVPFDVFPTTPRLALTYALPLAFIVFVPAQAITGRLQMWQLPIAFALAAIFLILANLAWRAGLRRYSSASS